MSDSLALLIGIERYQGPGLASAPHAASDAAAMARALDALGVPADARTVLFDAQATRTAVTSRLRKLAKSPPKAKSLLVWVGGLMFHEDGENFLACHDTQADDLAETSVALRELFAALKQAGCAQTVVFLDPRGGTPAAAFDVPALADVRGMAVFCSHGESEASHLSGSLKAGIWAHHIAEAFAGVAPMALEEGGLLTAVSLQAHLLREVPRTLRTTYREAPEQTPTVFGKLEKVVLANVAAIVPAEQPVADPRLLPLKRGVLRGETRGRVKSLGGYRKFHRLPDRINEGSRRFVAELAAADVQADVDQFYAAIRELLGYKRRDVEGSADRGSGFVRTPDFEYSVSVHLDDEDPTAIVWRREVGGIRNPEVVLGGPFQQVFGEQFDTLVFEFTRPFDLEAWVDRIEEEVPPGVKLRCAPDCSSCDVTVAGFVGIVRLLRDRVEVHGQKTPTSRGLVEAFLQFQDRFSGRRDLQELPLLPGPS